MCTDKSVTESMYMCRGTLPLFHCRQYRGHGPTSQVGQPPIIQQFPRATPPIVQVSEALCSGVNRRSGGCGGVGGVRKVTVKTASYIHVHVHVQSISCTVMYTVIMLCVHL